MAWVGGMLLCEAPVLRAGEQLPCQNFVVARRQGLALLYAARHGWWRGRRGGVMADYCPACRPDMTDPVALTTTRGTRR